MMDCKLTAGQGVPLSQVGTNSAQGTCPRVTDHVVKFSLNPSELEKWMHQNKAEYSGSFIDGCLLDNFVVMTKRGFAAFYEHYVNGWTSDYIVEFEPSTAQTVWRRWYDFEEGRKHDEYSGR